MSGPIVVYGSYGYTGKLIVEECKKHNLHVILAGRNEKSLIAQHEQTGYPYQVVEINEKEKLQALLKPAVVVIHCGGPFLFTAKRMALACIATNTHYTDITGEIGVFESLFGFDELAKKANIMLLPGTGFDVVPSDCLALHLKNRLPEATHLELAFATAGGGVSRGTAKTAVLGLGEGSCVRKDGKIVKVPLHRGIKEIDFGSFKTIAARIPWGDVSTAFHSTGIPNVEVYMGINKKIGMFIRSTPFLNWLLKSRWVKGLLLKRLDKMDGPSENAREHSNSHLVGKAWKENEIVQSQLLTPNGYALTTLSSVSVARKILNGNFKSGFQTPSSAYGADLIMEFDGVTRKDF
ncbi:MAG TPA: saccharopine dehydrogenase NADP-binding domain-containing protein [Cyclobacteriaceae bacterium]